MTPPTPSFVLRLIDPEHVAAFASALQPWLRAGDLLVLRGDLGAGKTTFTRALGEAMHVRGAVTSPTFVIVRHHPPMTDGPGLVHVDAYRLDDALDIDGIDLDDTLPDNVTVVEWGTDRVEHLSPHHLHISLEVDLPVSEDANADAAMVSTDLTPEDHAPRLVTLLPSGQRWLEVWQDMVSALRAVG